MDDDTRRRVVLEAAHNVRDLGGHQTDDGRATRWGLLYRADSLGRLTAADLEVVRSLGLRTVIDLRTHAEIDERGRFPHEQFDVDFAHHPILDVLWPEGAEFADDREFLLWAYRDLLAVGEHRFGAAISRLAQPEALPAVFHCAAGKDRTGLLAALLLSAIGVRREEVLADYALTAAGIARLLEWSARSSPEAAQRVAAMPPWYFAALPEALDQILTDLCDQHGSIPDYLVSVGVEPGDLDRLVNTLLTS